MIKKTKLVFIAFITVIIILTTVTIFMFFNSESDIKLSKLGLTLDDVPSGFDKDTEFYKKYALGEEEDILPGVVDAYYVYFSNFNETKQNNESEDNQKNIICTLLKFNSVDSADDAFYYYAQMDLPTSESHDIINIEIIGQESILKVSNISENLNFSHSEVMLNFRISNIIVSIITILNPTEDNISITVNLAKIVEQKINASLN